MKKVAIPEKMEKFYGTGTILHPDQEMIEEMIREIPSGKVATVDAVCQKLAEDHDTNVTCPMRTSNFVKTITKIYADNTGSIPFWRVIGKNHRLINSAFVYMCVERLEKEGFGVKESGKGEFEVLDIENRLFTFADND